MTREDLVEKARAARLNAHAPYSGFRVGAALLAQDGTVVTGANVENASYGATVCAERVALFAAVAAGHRSFAAMAVVTQGQRPSPPCGICLQALGEFCDDLPIHLALPEGDVIVDTSLRALLPAKFRLQIKVDG